VIERPYTSASNTARRIPERRSAAKAKWEADKYSRHFSYTLKGRTGTKRPVPMTSVKLPATRFYRLKWGHAPNGVYLKRFGHREDDKSGGAAAEAGRPRRGSTSSPAAAGGETSNRHYGRRWEKRRAGKRVDADTCRSLSCFPRKSATKR